MGAPRLPPNPPRDASRRCGRARHWAHKGRAPDGSRLPQRHDGDRINAVLTAAGYSFSLLLRWLERLLRVLIGMLRAPPVADHAAQPSAQELERAPSPLELVRMRVAPDPDRIPLG